MLITPPYTFPAVYSDGTVSTYSQERDANMRNPYNSGFPDTTVANNRLPFSSRPVA